MPDRLFRLYQRRRVININANIVAAGLLSTVLVSGLLWVLMYPLKQEWPSWGYTGFSVVADIVLDVAIFAGLHLVANHWRPKRGPLAAAPGTGVAKELAAKAPDATRDTAQIQVERAVISPMYYLIAAGGTQWLQQEGLGPYWAVLIAYPAGLAVTRSVHTYWGLRSGTYQDHHIAAKRRRIAERKAARAERAAAIERDG